MTRPLNTGDHVRLPGGGTATVIAPADAAGLVLVRVTPTALASAVPVEHLQPLQQGATS